MIAYLRLVRFPVAFSAATNALAGCCFALAPGAHVPWGRLALLLPGSACLGLGGMALNDFFDRARDRSLRPERPIPSGAVSPGAALLLGLGLLSLGVVLAVAASAASGLAAAAAAGLILAYDGGLKRSGSAGAWTLGLARAANAVAGTVVAGAPGLHVVRIDPATGAGVQMLNPAWFYPLLLLLYVQAITQLSRLEDEELQGRQPALAILPYALLLALGPWVLHVRIARQIAAERPGAEAAYVVLALLTILVVARTVPAVRDPSTIPIRRLVGGALLGMLLFDSAAILSGGHLAPGLAALAALPLAWLAGRAISIT